MILHFLQKLDTPWGGAKSRVQLTDILSVAIAMAQQWRSDAKMTKDMTDKTIGFQLFGVSSAKT